MSQKKMLAIDLGASSGRGIIGGFDGKKFTLNEIHRFSNDPVTTPTGFYWDTLRLLFEIKTAILKSNQEGGIDTIGIDTWGVDYGFLDKTGALISNPFHYRDTRTMDIENYVFNNFATWDEIYDTTGIQSMNFNTLYQLAADRRDRPWLLEHADKMLNTPDLLGYFLTGEKLSEYTIVSTGALLNAYTRTYADELLQKCGIPRDIFCDIAKPGTILGTLLPGEETGNSAAKVIKVASHDTASAVMAVPAENEDFLYISSGTWSLLGIESKTPIINDLSKKYQLTNEGGVDGTIRVMKNIMGLWLEQESRRQWAREGTKYSFDELSSMAKESKPFQCFINPDDIRFSTAGNMPKRIREYCKETGQYVPETVGEIVRCIFESLALKYRWTAEKMEEVSGRKYSFINIVGGGTKEEMLSQFAADASHRMVVAGPVEATCIGNIAMQSIASGDVKDLWEARAIVRDSFDVKEYKPNTETAAAWDDAYGKFCALLEN
ncbi:MAG: rhamnulokinase [Clostridia bacterium]|nr:rhamnulokinase [Clostridia bacterium]